jgi:hypothetical protein
MLHFCSLVSNAEFWRTRCTCYMQRIKGHKCKCRCCLWPVNRKDHSRERENGALVLPSVAWNSVMQRSQCSLWYSKDVTVPLTTHPQFPARNYPLQFLACLLALLAICNSHFSTRVKLRSMDIRDDPWHCASNNYFALSKLLYLCPH